MKAPPFSPVEGGGVLSRVGGRFVGVAPTGKRRTSPADVAMCVQGCAASF